MHRRGAVVAHQQYQAPLQLAFALKNLPKPSHGGIQPAQRPVNRRRIVS
jgi:hypothetical protein